MDFAETSGLGRVCSWKKRKERASVKIGSHRESVTWAEPLNADPSVHSPISQSCPHPWGDVPGHLRTQEVAQLIPAQITLERMAEVPLWRSGGQIQTFFQGGSPKSSQEAEPAAGAQEQVWAQEGKEAGGSQAETQDWVRRWGDRRANWGSEADLRHGLARHEAGLYWCVDLARELTATSKCVPDTKANTLSIESHLILTHWTYEVGLASILQMKRLRFRDKGIVQSHWPGCGPWGGGLTSLPRPPPTPCPAGEPTCNGWSVANSWPSNQRWAAAVLDFSGQWFKQTQGTCLVVEWLRICLAIQGTRVWSLIRELRIHVQLNLCTTKDPVCYN